MKKFYNKELKSAGCPVKRGMTEESGRSMVEMLGVLAVMGVLSVGGVAMYTSAMNKHRANELLNEASKRAAVVAVQAMQGRETLSIAEFPDNATLKFNTEVIHDTANGQFTLEIDGVAEAVCQQMNNAKGPVIRKFEPATCLGDSNTVKLTYNDDMSATAKASDFNGNETGCEADSSRQYCTSNDTCISATDTCPSTGPSCPGNSSVTEITDGTSFRVTESGESITCWCPAGQSYQSTGCANAPTTGCDDHTANQCGLGYYCKFSPSSCSASGDGVCTKITGGDDSSGHWVGPSLDWWSANSWCIGKGSTGLITYSTLQSTYSCNKSSNSCNWDALDADGLSDYYWSAEDYGNSCNAWDVDVGDELFSYGHTRTSRFYALCE